MQQAQGVAKRTDPDSKPAADRFFQQYPLVPIPKNKLHSKTMIENGLDIRIIFTKGIDKQSDRFLLFGQLTGRVEKAHYLNFLKFLLASRTNNTFGFPRHTSPPFTKSKEPFYLCLIIP